MGQGDVTLLARIQQLDPVYVDFTQSAAEVLRLREALRDGSLGTGEDDALSVGIEGTQFEARGALMFTDVMVDPSTGQVALRGKFPNPEGTLLPGMFVRVRAPQGLDQQAILIPQRAVQRGPDGGASVLVIGADGRAEVRGVKTGVMQGSRWQIREGLKPGDQVIVSGLAGLQPGTAVVAHQAQEQQAARQ
ncbi:Multidrug efflux pump subunit AcrA precursor [compost metagenome]